MIKKMIGIFKYYEIKLVHVTAIVRLVPEMYPFEVPYQEKKIDMRVLQDIYQSLNLEIMIL